MNSNNDGGALDSVKLFFLCTAGGGRITKYSGTITKMNNGIDYYCVEVTSKDGIQYGIQAFGEEAIALYNETMNFIEENLDIVNNKRVS